MYKTVLPILLFAMLSTAGLCRGEDLEMINRPVNLSGMTGILFTTAPYTLPDGTFEFALGALSENSMVPDYTLTEMPILTVSYGMGPRSEIAVKGSYLRDTLNSTSRRRGAGDTEISYKWDFLPQKEDSVLPAVALVITGIAPTENKNLNVSGVVHWGAKAGLSAGSEIPWGDHIVGVYLDGELAAHDLADADHKDVYGILNGGVLLPISKNRNLQMFLEYSLIAGMDQVTAVGGNSTGTTYGLRLVNETFNLTIGTQFLRKDVEGFDKSSRVIGMMSIKL